MTVLPVSFKSILNRDAANWCQYMSSLTSVEKLRFEDILSMGGGYVLQFTNESFAQVFRDNAGLNIYDARYTSKGDSKAKCLRAFWEIESDPIVGKLLEALLDIWRYQKVGDLDARTAQTYAACLITVARLTGKQSDSRMVTEDDFLKTDFGKIAFDGLDLDSNVIPLLSVRIREAELCLNSGAYLGSIFLSGSALEGILLNVATSNSLTFIQANNAPKVKNSEKVKPIQVWTLAELIDVAHEVDYLRLDVKKFSHVLRDFRNYIHPYAQMSANFRPDRHTAGICLQVLRAAIIGLKDKHQQGL